ncbi:MAG: Na/Pi cotransporter family protein [Candidatus Marinimicrobia bacterium]|nr:Na/Pi cotransporter family protein [Candidatus Neomarinimicrobiota bacterium]
MGADGSVPPISWGFLIMGLLGGLSLFLYGMGKMSHGMKQAAGNRLRLILAALTKHRMVGFSFGAFVTMIIQSSSATTVMLVSFVQAELMTYTQSLAVIIGAGVGTTITAQLIAFKLTDYALVMISIGFFMTLLSKREAIQHIGEALLGFGILFFGMKLMSDSMAPLRSYAPFIQIMEGLDNRLLGLLIGTLFTALIQSSSAFIGIVIVLSQQGLLSLEAGIPLILGANIGTCITAGLASIGTNKDAKRVALAHVIFKIGGVLIFIWFVDPLAEFVRSISPVSDLTGIEKLAVDTPRQIANAHTLFNVSLGLLFLPFTTVFAALIYKLLPDSPVDKGVVPATWHIKDSSIATPDVALDLARAEVARMAKILGRMLEAVIKPFISPDPGADRIYPQLSLMEGIEMRDKKVDYLEYRVSAYLMKIAQQQLTDKQVREVSTMISIVSDMESIGDIIKRNIIPLIAKKRALDLDFSEAGKEELILYHTKICKQMARLRTAFSGPRITQAEKILKKEEKYLDLEARYRSSHLERIGHAQPESIKTHEIHMELLDMLKRINVYTGDIAKTMYLFQNKGE